MNQAIHRLTPDHADAYSHLRAQSVIHHPSAYSMDLEILEAAPRESVISLLTPGEAGFLLGASHEGELVGILGLKRIMRWKASHMGTLWGLYVAPEHRRRGFGRALLGAMLEEARAVEGLEQLRLMVPTELTPAMALFEAHGFEPYGLEHRGRRTEAGYHDLSYMMRLL